MDHRSIDADAFDGAATSFLNDNQQYSAIDSLFPHETSNPSFNDSAWNLNGSPYAQPSELTRGDLQSTWSPAQQHSLGIQHFQGRSARNSPLPHAQYAPQYAYQGYGAQQSFNYGQPQYDPSLIHDAQAFKPYNTPYQTVQPSSTTITPQALEHEDTKTPIKRSPPQISTSLTNNVMHALQFDQNALIKRIPASNKHGTFNIIKFDDLAKATESQRLCAFANIAHEPTEWPINRAALPAYLPRKSKNALKRLAGQDSVLLAKINSKGAKKQRTLAKPNSKLLARTKQIKDESSSSEDESDYTDDSDVEESPLPVKRPDGLKEGVEYDTIKTLWRSKRKTVSVESVKQGLKEFWEVVKTIRDTWKTDTEALVKATSADKKGQLPVLRQRVKDQRDLFELAISTAFKHGNRTIVENLSEHTGFLYACYQFLLDRLKNDDVNGSLARAVLELMSTFTSLTHENFEKTNLSKIMSRYLNKGDARTKGTVSRIIGKTSAQASGTGATTPADAKPKTNGDAIIKTEPGVGVKRPAPAAEDGKAAKRAAVAATKPVAAVKKRPADSDTVNNPAAKKIATSTTTAQSDVTKAKPASRLTNPLFSSISASKKPGTSIKTGNTSAKVGAKVTAPVTASAAPSFSIASLAQSLQKPTEEKSVPKQKEVTPSETVEQKARRLRREARGSLRVHWKNGEDLVQVKTFIHDPEEEFGHDASQTRDVTDIKGEGRMFKQQHNNMTDIDDDDDDTAVNAASTDQTAMGKMIEWIEPGLVDFSVFTEEERNGTYVPYGGGRLVPDSKEQIEREKYEANTLSVYYSRPEDIPPNPAEPAEAVNGDTPETVLAFGLPESMYSDRARQARQMQSKQYGQVNGASHMPGTFNYNGFGNTQPQQSFQPPAPDLHSILASLAAGNAQKAHQAPAQPPQWPAPPQPAPQQPAFDIAGLLATIKGATTQQPAPPPVVPPPVPAAPNFADPGFQAWMAQQIAAGNIPAPPGAASQSNNVSGSFENPERRRMWEEGALDTDGKPKNYKTQVCRFYQEGKCTKGDECTYRHD